LIPDAPEVAEALAGAEVLADAELVAAALALELLELLELELHAARADTAATVAKARTAGLRTTANRDLL
jgi:hypothetical protein